MKYIPNALTFCTQSRSSLLIINVIFEISYYDRKLKTRADLVPKLQLSKFYEIWYSEQIEHANYEYINWN